MSYQKKRTMKKALFAIFLLSIITGFAQGEANNWFFGHNAGIDFNGTSPVAISGSLYTTEGCASFSDNQGNLLFYTDGITVWDREHREMPNGQNLLGDPSSTQSGIIVPHPGNENLFYIFTVGANDYSNDGVLTNPTEGLHCYTLDITENSGYGDIIGSPIRLSGFDSPNWTEKVTSVKGADCNTFWVVSLVGNTYISFKIDSNGLDENGIASRVLYDSSDPRGYLKISPDGKKIASACYGTGIINLYSFNDRTGKVSNDGLSLIRNPELDGYAYGVEFSQNSTKLYCATFDGQDTNRLFQFDLSNSNILITKYLVNSELGFRGGLQLAPNGKIYATVPATYQIGTRFLNAINFPNELGEKCEFELGALNLGSGSAMQGLPPFIASLLLPAEITSEEFDNAVITNQTLKLCVGSDYTFNTEEIIGTATYTWTYNGVPISGETSSSLAITDIQLNEAGSYGLKAELTDLCGNPKVYEGKFEIEVYIPPATFSDVVFDQCDIDTNPTDRETVFNLSTKISEITNDDPNLEVVFYNSQAELDLNTPIANPNSYIATNGLEILVKLINSESGCCAIGKMVLNVYPTSLDSYNDYFTCENDLSENNSSAIKSEGSGNGTFDFETKRTIIHNIFSNDPNLEIEFYKNANDAQLQNEPIIGVLDYTSTEIFVRVSNKQTNNCLSAGKFNLVVNPVPVPNGSEDPITLCVNNPKDNPQLFTVSLSGGKKATNETYQWYFNNSIIDGATEINYNANAGGTYKIEITRSYENLASDSTDDSFCTGFNTFIVIESSPPALTQNDITVIDDSINNSISISTSNLGLGEYEFSLNNAIANFQDEPIFENLESGIYTVFVRDKNGCGNATPIEVSVIGFPKFFTPNFDGENDTWSITGVNSKFYSGSKIYIFDRYGKLITQINPKGNGWNGLYNGEQLPASDYWFTAELIDEKGIVRIKKGHFSLIR